MKFTLSWLKDHLATDAGVGAVADAMTAAGLEVEHLSDPAAKLAPFTVCRIVEAVQHPNADRLRVCQVDTVDGRKEIVCGAPNARAGLTTIYAPIGAYVPGLGVTLVAKPVRGVVSAGMLCSLRELEVSEEGEGIAELPDTLAVGAPAATVFGADSVIDFEVTPNRPDWLGVAGIARDLHAAGLGDLLTPPVEPVVGAFPCPVRVRLEAGDACPLLAGRVVRGVRNGPSPPWLQQRLRAIGLRPISALVDVTNYLSYDRARPLHVYDLDAISGDTLTVRLAREGESLAALDGRTYPLGPEMTVIADGSGVVDLAGVMGGASTGVRDETTCVFIEAAWFDPLRTAQTGRELSLFSDAQYRFARGVDPGFVLQGLELATRMILDLCGGEASDLVVEGAPPAPPRPIDFDPEAVRRLTGLELAVDRITDILQRLGFAVAPADDRLHITPPTWRRDVDGPADLVEEVARIEGLAALPSTPLPDAAPPVGGVATPRQTRARTARRTLAAAGFLETVGWSFTSHALAELFGGGGAALRLVNPIASELDWMRPSALPGLLQAVGRNRSRGVKDCALFEVGPVFSDPTPAGQRTAVAAVLAPGGQRRWDGGRGEDVFTLKGHLLSLLEGLGAPVASLQLVQEGVSPWWRPGRTARLQLGRTTVAEFGALHPRVLKALDLENEVYAFELWLEALPEPKRATGRTARTPFDPPTLTPVARDFAFVVERARPAGDLVRAAAGVDKALISSVQVFDVYEGPGVAEGLKSVALEVVLQPRAKTLTEAEIEAVSAQVVKAVGKATGAELRR